MERLQKDENLDSFFLVGGTALALQIGHRYSIDLDFFCLTAFDTEEVAFYLSGYNFQVTAVAKNSLLGVIDGVKTDFIAHRYPLVEPLTIIDGIQMASLLDIGAMKLNAIVHSGQRLKDFIDIFCLLEVFPLNELLIAYQKKYANANTLIALKGLTYFDDLDLNLDRPIMKREIKMDVLKTRLKQAVESPNRIFSKE